MPAGRAGSKNYLAMFIFFAASSLAFGQTSTSGDPAITQALKDAGATSNDTLQAKVNLLLHLINDRPYLDESNPDPTYAGYAKFTATPFKRANVLLSQYAKGSDTTNPYQPYDLDTMRTPREIIDQKIGGQCGSHARSFAELLEALGVPSSDIRIVSTVCDEEYNRLCPGGKDSKRDTNAHDLSGHVFVLLKVGEKWKIINTTMGPMTPDIDITGKNAAKLKHINANHFSSLTGPQYDQMIHDTVKNLDQSDVEMVDFPSPDELNARMKNGELVPIPDFKSLPESTPTSFGYDVHFRKMSVFDVSTPESYPMHKWNDRYNFIASGKVDSDVCRFDDSKRASAPAATQPGAQPQPGQH